VPTAERSASFIIYGATHTGIRLAHRLAEKGPGVVLIDRASAPSEPPRGWEYRSADFTVTAEVASAMAVFAVTDEDRLNIRIALAVRTASATVPVVITLAQSSLGKKLVRHLEHFSFISPPELAAREFADAVLARSADVSAPVAMADVQSETLPVSGRIDPLVKRALGVIIGMAAFASFYFHFAEGLSWIDSVYFVVTLMATVGFGDISLRSSTTLSKIIGIALMVASITNTAIIFALISDSVLKRRLALSFGRRRVKQSGHVLVAGIGSVGFRICEELSRRGESVVAIEEQGGGRYLPALYSKRVPALVGDARLERTLIDAGVLSAKALLSVTTDDMTNLEIGLNAKALNPKARVVLRIYDQALAEALRERLGIHFALSMSAIAAGVLVEMADRAEREV
jgi:Trk K+ transport system NAD-binding subunit